MNATPYFVQMLKKSLRFLISTVVWSCVFPYFQAGKKETKDYLTAVQFRVGCFTAKILNKTESVELVLVPIRTAVDSIN